MKHRLPKAQNIEETRNNHLQDNDTVTTTNIVQAKNCNRGTALKRSAEASYGDIKLVIKANFSGAQQLPQF